MWNNLFKAFCAVVATKARLSFADEGCDHDDQPNIVFLLVDDWGAGDVDMCPKDSDYKTCPFRPQSDSRRAHLHTPRIRQMAEEGQILTNYYSPRAICTPSRAGMLSGRDPSRYGLIDNLFRIMQSSSARGGMPTSEKSVAKYLKEAGYFTGYSGKWHMGATNGTNTPAGNAAYTAINHGFDFVKFFIEGSNGEQCEEGALNAPGDNNIYHMCSFDHIQDCDASTKTCEVVEQPIRWENITSRHLRVFKEFIDEHAGKGKPFFYQHAFTAVHVPWVPSRFFVTDPVMKFWTDFVNEVDWAVGYILKYLKENAPNTIVVLSSDNGPYKESASSYCPQNCRWHTPQAQKDGVPGDFGCSPCDESVVSRSLEENTGGKGNTWEGGQHVPAIAWWPEQIKAGSINPMVSSGLDLLPTFVELAGGSLDENTAYDGKSITKYLCSKNIKATKKPKGNFVYWCGLHINAIRVDQYKVIYRTQNFVGATPDQQTPPNLCGQGGDCCPGSPSRLCICEWPFATNYTVPKVINLIDNPNEDLSKALDNMNKVIEKAKKIRKKLLKSVLKDRKVPKEYYDKKDSMNMAATLGELPNFPNTDLCMDSPLSVGPYLSGPIDGNENDWTRHDATSPDGCGFVPENYQKSYLPGNDFDFFPFQNCSITRTYQGPQCAQRLPCCQQDGYEGPFEYIKPENSDKDGWEGNTYKCGCFNNGGSSSVGSTSHFPLDDYMQESVCDWQREVYEDLKKNNQLYFFQGFCMPSWCADETYSKVTNNQGVCNAISDYGLSSAPTGNLFNLPYPETQDMTWQEMYPNQDEEPSLEL